MPVLVSDKLDEARYAEDIRICVAIACAWQMRQGPMNCLFGMELGTADNPTQLTRILELAPSEKQVRLHLAIQTATCEEVQARCEAIKSIKTVLDQIWKDDPPQQWAWLDLPQLLLDEERPRRVMLYGGLTGLQRVVRFLERKGGKTD